MLVGNITLLTIFAVFDPSQLTVIIVKKLNSLKHLVRTTVAESHN